jgi:hypothetical protein
MKLRGSYAWFWIVLLCGVATASEALREPVVPDLTPSPNLSASTIPTTGASSGDLNPYGIAFVPDGFQHHGLLEAGDILVSNFNNSTNTQGTGRSIVRITPGGAVSAFFEGSQRLGPLGLTTALGVFREGFVVVGSVPNSNGVAQQGSLLVLRADGSLIANVRNSKFLDSPWDLTIYEDDYRALVFVSNVLSGTVTRLDFRTFRFDHDDIGLTATRIASGYTARPDPAALVVGPTGLAYDASRDILYVASTGDNEIFAIPNAGTRHTDAGEGQLVYQDSSHLHGPLGLVLAPNGDLIASNGDAVNPDPNHLNEVVEFTPAGKFVAQFQIDSGAAGGAFGIALAASDDEVRFAAVDDNTNTANIWIVK